MSTGDDTKKPTSGLGLGDDDIDEWGDLFDGLHEEDQHGSVDALLGGQEPLPEEGRPESLDEALGDLVGDDSLEFIGEAQALGGMLGSDPLPLAEPEPGEADAVDADTQPRSAPTPEPPRPFVQTNRAPVLPEAPSDDELFGSLPDQVPEAEATIASSHGAEEATRVAEAGALPIAQSARAGAAIVRREDLAKRAGAGVTRMTSAEVRSDLADAAVREFEEMPVTAESEVVEVDEDFYGDIEIGADDAAEAAPDVDDASTSARRLAHTVRRDTLSPERADAEDALPVFELEADARELTPPPPAQPTEVVSGTTGRQVDDDDAVISSGAGLDRGSAVPVPIPDEDAIDLQSAADLEMEGVEPEPVVADKLEAVDVAPEMPASSFTAGEPALDLDQLSLPFEAEPSATAGTEDATHELALYQREIERLDDPVGIAELRLEAGRLAELTGDVNAAREHFAAAAEADPRSVLAASALRRTAYAAGKSGEALDALATEIGLASAAERRALAEWRIDLLMSSGETDLAAEGVARLLDDTPEDAGAHIAALELAFMAGDAAKLARHLEALATIVGPGPYAEALHTERGRATHAAGDGDAAVAAYQAVLRSTPASRPATWGLERVALEAGRLIDASAAAGRILQTGLAETDPDLAGAIALRRARIARDAGDPDGWVEGLEAAARLSPEDATVFRDLAEALERQGDAGAAVRAYLTAASLSASPIEQADAYRRAARLLGAGAGTPHDTVEAVRRLFALDPDDAEAQVVLETALAEAGDLDALVEMDRAAAEADDQGGVFERIRIAKRLFAGGHVPEAVRELEAARVAAPNAPVVTDTLARILAAAGLSEHRAQLLAELAETEAEHRDPEVAAVRAAQAAEDFAYELMAADSALAAAGPAALDRAIAAWTRVLEFDPESRSAHSALVRLAEQRDEPTEVLRALAGAQNAAQHPARVTGLALRRQALLLSGGLPNPEAAEEVLRDVRARAPDDPRSGLALVMLTASAGRWADAAGALEEQANAVSSPAYAQALRFRAADILHEHTDEAARVVELLAPVVAAYPDFAPAGALLESSHRKLGDASSLSDHLERRLSKTAAEGSEQFAILVREAEVFEFQVGDQAKAAHLYAKALEDRPFDPLARDGFTRTSEAAGETGSLSQLALDDLKRAEDTNDPTEKADAYEELARIDLELRGDPGSARFSYESAAKIDPTRFAVLRSLELSYLADERDGDLARIYNWEVDALNHPADAIHVSLERARVLQRANKPATDVLAEYKRAFELDQRCSLALQQLEAAERRSGPSEMLAAFEEAAARYFDTDERAKAAFLTRAGETRYALEDVEGAIDCFKAAIETLPGYLPALIGWRRAALAGQLWLDVGEAAERQAEYEIDDAERAALEHLAGVVYMDRANSPERAIPPLQRVLTLAPDHIDAYVRLRMMFEESGAHDELAQLLGQRLEVEDSPPYRREIHHALAAIHRDYLEHPEGAMKELRAALDIDPGDSIALRGLADIAWDRGEWQDAAETLVKVATMSRDKAERIEIFHKLGQIYTEHIPDIPTAVTSYQRVIQLDPSDERALLQLSKLAAQTGDWKRALMACERMLRNTERSAESKIEILHQVGDIYGKMEEPARAEKAYRAALDVDPTSSVALDALVRFYRLGGDLRSLRVHLDTVAGAMRKRLTRVPLDVTAYHVLAKVLDSREEAGGQGSRAAAMCAAELSRALGSEDEHDARLAEAAGEQTPDVSGLGSAEIDDILFPRSVPNGLRQMLRAIDDRLCKATSGDLKRYSVGRGERLRAGDPAADIIGLIAGQLGIRQLEIYVTKRVQNALAAETDGDDVKLIIGAALADAQRPGPLRFLAGRALKMAVSGMSVPARMEANDFGAMLVALLRSFRPEFSPGGVDMGAVANQQGRIKKVITGGMLQELGPYAMECASVDFDNTRIWEGIIHTANRAGLICAGSIQAAMEGLMLLHELPDANAAANHPIVQQLMRYSVSEDHVIVRRMLLQAQAAAGSR